LLLYLPGASRERSRHIGWIWDHKTWEAAAGDSCRPTRQNPPEVWWDPTQARYVWWHA